LASPTFTIVTAVLNRRTTILDALESLRAQSYAQVEHLVMDGGSTDGTPEALRALAQEGMMLVSEPDHGVYDALNKGISLASGEIIGILHSDDLYGHREVLERVAGTFEDPTIDAVYGDLDYVSRGDVTRVIRRWRAGPFSPDLLSRGWMPPHPTFFMRRRLFVRLGAYDTSFRISADYDAILRYFGKGGIRAAYLPEVLVKMRVGGESNRSLRNMLRKSLEDYRAIRKHRIGGVGTLLRKNLSKLGQFGPHDQDG
jgi:glycosyltransferase involved in cell wall biosynthesis